MVVGPDLGGRLFDRVGGDDAVLEGPRLQTGRQVGRQRHLNRLRQSRFRRDLRLLTDRRLRRLWVMIVCDLW